MQEWAKNPFYIRLCLPGALIMILKNSILDLCIYFF